MQRGFAVAMLVLLVFTLSGGLGAAEPAFTNPAPRFKVLSAQEERAVLDRAMAQAPDLSEKEKARIESGKVVVREMERRGDARRYEALARVKAPPSRIMALMRSFDRHVGVMPHLKAVDAVWEGPNLARVTQTLSVALTTYVYTIRVYHYSDSYIEWEYLHGDLKDTHGYYKMFPREGGETLLVYHLFTDPGKPVPEFIMNLVTRHSMPKVLESIRSQAEASAGAEGN